MNYKSKKSKKGGVRSMDEIHRLKGIKSKETDTQNPYLQDIIDKRKFMERNKTNFKKNKKISLKSSTKILRPIHRTKIKNNVKSLEVDLAKKIVNALMQLGDNEKEFIMDSFDLPSPQEIKMQFDWNDDDDDESEEIAGEVKQPYFKIKETKNPDPSNIPMKDKGKNTKEDQIGTEIASGDDGQDHNDNDKDKKNLPEDKKDEVLPGFSDEEVDELLDEMIKKENNKEIEIQTDPIVEPKTEKKEIEIQTDKEKKSTKDTGIQSQLSDIVESDQESEDIMDEEMKQLEKELANELWKDKILNRNKKKETKDTGIQSQLSDIVESDEESDKPLVLQEQKVHDITIPKIGPKPVPKPSKLIIPDEETEEKPEVEVVIGEPTPPRKPDKKDDEFKDEAKEEVPKPKTKLQLLVEEYNKSASDDKKLLSIGKQPDFMFELAESGSWEEFSKLFKSIFVENSAFFKSAIFKFEYKAELFAFFILLKHFLDKLSIDRKIEELAKINVFFPELFQTQIIEEYLLFNNINVNFSIPYLTKAKKSKNSLGFDYLGIDLLQEISKLNEDKKISKFLKLTELFPEFVKNPQFCTIIKKTHKIIDVLHLIPFLDKDDCADIDWSLKLKNIMDANISKEDKDYYMIYFLLSVPNPDTVSILLKFYRRKQFNFKLLNSLISILNFDNRFIDNIKDERISRKFEDRIMELRESASLKEELWLWILQYAVTYDNIDDKLYYFQILNNYFMIVPKNTKNIFKKLLPFSNKDSRELQKLYLKENIEFIFKNYPKMKPRDGMKKKPNILKETAYFFNKYKEYLSDVYTDAGLNAMIYNYLVKDFYKYRFEGFALRSERILKDNLKILLRIKFESLMYNLKSDAYKKEMDKIEKVEGLKDIRQLRTDFYVSIKKEIDARRFHNILFLHDARVLPTMLLTQYVVLTEEELKKQEEEEEKSFLESIGEYIPDIKAEDMLGERSIEQELQYLYKMLDSNDAMISNLKTIHEQKKKDLEEK